VGRRCSKYGRYTPIEERGYEGEELILELVFYTGRKYIKWGEFEK
jgi:hypothetical protein